MFNGYVNLAAISYVLLNEYVNLAAIYVLVNEYTNLAAISYMLVNLAAISNVWVNEDVNLVAINNALVNECLPCSNERCFGQ